MDVSDSRSTTAHVESLWGCTLSFRNDEQEKRFNDEDLAVKVGHDALVHPTAMVVGPIFIFVHWSDLSWFGVALMVIGSGVFAPILTFLSRWRKPFYSKWRTLMILSYGAYAMCTLHVLGANDLPPANTFGGVAIRFLARSPAMLALFYCLNFSVSFVCQVLFQLLVLPGLVSWSQRFCGLCTTSKNSFAPIFQTSGQVIDRIIFIFLGTTNKGIEFRCVSVVSWTSLFVGVLVPIGIVYLRETFHRGDFASKTFPQEMRHTVERTKSESREIGVLYFVALAELIWIVCRVFEDELGGH